MNFFVASSSKATAHIAEVLCSPRIKYFSENTTIPKHVMPKDFKHHFDNSDALILNGTWGSKLRKKLYLPKCENGVWKDGNIPRHIYKGNKLPDKSRFAILDYINSELVLLARKQKKPIIVLESATISRAEKNYAKDYDHKNFVRISLDNWSYGDGKWLDENNVDNIRTVNASRLYNHQWKSEKEGSIYIFTGLETDPTSTMPIEQFITSSIKKIRNHTNKRICIKVHPGSKNNKAIGLKLKNYENVDLIEKRVPIQNFYQDMYCAVIDNSTSIFELIDAGIPTFCSDTNFGSLLHNTDLNNICDPYFATQKEILNWTNKMSCTEFTKKDISSPNIVHILEKLVRKNKEFK